MRRVKINKRVMLVVLIAALGLAGCQEKGPMEKAGERADEIVDNVERRDQPFEENGVMDEVDESIDNAVRPGDKQ